MVFLPIRTSQREIGDDRCVSGPSSFFTSSVIYPPLLIYAQPALALTRTHAAQTSCEHSSTESTVYFLLLLLLLLDNKKVK